MSTRSGRGSCEVLHGRTQASDERMAANQLACYGSAVGGTGAAAYNLGDCVAGLGSREVCGVHVLECVPNWAAAFQPNFNASRLLGSWDGEMESQCLRWSRSCMARALVRRVPANRQRSATRLGEQTARLGRWLPHNGFRSSMLSAGTRSALAREPTRQSTVKSESTGSPQACTASGGSPPDPLGVRPRQQSRGRSESPSALLCVGFAVAGPASGRQVHRTLQWIGPARRLHLDSLPMVALKAGRGDGRQITAVDRAT